MAVRLKPESEAGFQKAVIDLARLCGWRVAHFRPARVMRRGKEIYETPVAADGKGWPDLCLVHAKRGIVIFAELKSETGKLSAAQSAWLDALHDAGERVQVWRPSDWPAIEPLLRGRDTPQPSRSASTAARGKRGRTP